MITGVAERKVNAKRVISQAGDLILTLHSITLIAEGEEGKSGARRGGRKCGTARGRGRGHSLVQLTPSGEGPSLAKSGLCKGLGSNQRWQITVTCRFSIAACLKC